ncbi:helix-turn-helix domain-containing protein [Sphingobacterium multivorum]|uniref:helix-turn-helix domain-containing protein n=1 Tax=Sphingobacterium multivorum TaxID=28454 RepID=UPI0031B9D638
MTRQEIYHGIIKLRNEGNSFMKIGKELNISETTASRWFNNGLPSKGKASIINLKSYRKAKAPKESNVDSVNKGLAKIGVKEKVFKNIKRNPADYRMVSMMDSKNTVLEFHKDDARLNDIPAIRAEWRLKQENKLKNLSA